jgi:hypothetical protein
VILALFFACAGDGDSAVSYDSASTDCPTEPPLTWNNFGHGFMTTYCLACHAESNTERRYGAPEGVNFDTEDDARLFLDRLRVRVLDEETMPVGGGVYADDLLQFARYLDCLAD